MNQRQTISSLHCTHSMDHSPDSTCVRACDEEVNIPAACNQFDCCQQFWMRLMKCLWSQSSGRHISAISAQAYRGRIQPLVLQTESVLDGGERARAFVCACVCVCVVRAQCRTYSHFDCMPTLTYFYLIYLINFGCVVHYINSGRLTPISRQFKRRADRSLELPLVFQTESEA